MQQSSKGKKQKKMMEDNHIAAMTENLLNNIHTEEGALSNNDIKSPIMDMWQKLENKDNLVALLNHVAKQRFGEKHKSYTIHMLNFQAYSSNNNNRYVSFQIPKKKKGEFRTIDAPNHALKSLQQSLNYILQQIYTPHTAAMGFVPNRSVATNAKVHVGQNYVYNIDLKDFFPSITSGRIYARLQAKPFFLSKDMASLISNLCCYTNTDGKNVLPQGAPTSPTITNIICERLDRKLARLAKAYGLRYTRYADDITFSGVCNVFNEDGKFCKSLKHIIEEEEHFTINATKTRLCHKGMRQEVTGLTTNTHLNVSRGYVKQLRTMLHLWETQGLEVAQNAFASHYTPKRINEKDNAIPHIENVIDGKLLYLKMVKGNNDATYNKLIKRYNKLLGIDEKEIANNETVAEINASKNGDDILFTELDELMKLLES